MVVWGIAGKATVYMLGALCHHPVAERSHYNLGFYSEQEVAGLRMAYSWLQ